MIELSSSELVLTSDAEGALFWHNSSVFSGESHHKQKLEEPQITPFLLLHKINELSKWL